MQEKIQLCNVLIQNNFLNMEKIIQGIYSATSESYIYFESAAKTPEAHDGKFKRDLMYIPVSREEGVELDANTLMEELESVRVAMRYMCFCIFANSMEAEEQNEPLSLSLAMDMRDILDQYLDTKFSTAFIEVGTGCAFYGFELLELFSLFITDTSAWEHLQTQELYEKAASTIAE